MVVRTLLAALGTDPKLDTYFTGVWCGQCYMSSWFRETIPKKLIVELSKFVDLDEQFILCQRRRSIPFWCIVFQICVVSSAFQVALNLLIKHCLQGC